MGKKINPPDKDPLVIESFQYKGGGNFESSHIPDWIWSALKEGRLLFHTNGGDPLKIKLQDEELIVNPGEYIIKGIAGGVFTIPGWKPLRKSNLNFHKVVSETPEEVKKEVSDWMDEQDRIHSSLPVEFADWLGYHLYHYNRVERKWERHMTPPPNKYTTSEVFEIFIQLKMLEQDEDWLYQNWCSIWSLAYKLSKSDFLTKMKQDYFIQANKVK